MELNSFSQSAPYLSNPLVLVGFVLILYFGIHRALLKSKIIPPVSRTTGGQIVGRLLQYGFIIAVLVILAGFFIEGWKIYVKEHKQKGDTDKILKGIESITTGFELLQKQGGLISNPS